MVVYAQCWQSLEVTLYDDLRFFETEILNYADQ